MNFRFTFDDRVADVKVIVVLVPADLGHQDGQVVVPAALDAEAQTSVRMSSQLNLSDLTKNWSLNRI